MSIKLHSHDYCKCMCVCRSDSVIIDNELFLSVRVLIRMAKTSLMLRRTTIFIHRNNIMCVFHVTTTAMNCFNGKVFKWWCVFNFGDFRNGFQWFQHFFVVAFFDVLSFVLLLLFLCFYYFCYCRYRWTMIWNVG